MSEDVGAATPETPDEQANSEVEGQTADQVEETEEQPEKTLTQSEVDKIVERRLAKDRGRHNRRIGALEAQLQAARDLQVQVLQGGDTPQRDQYDSYEDYLEAKAEWKADQTVSKRLQQVEQERTQRAQFQQHEKVAETWEERKEQGRQKYADFDDVAGSEDVQVTRAMASAIMESPAGHDISYHLGQNPAEAERIGKLSPTRQIAEIAKLEDKLSAKPPKISSAPEPISAINKGREPVRALSDSLSTSEWIKRFNKDMGYSG